MKLKHLFLLFTAVAALHSCGDSHEGHNHDGHNHEAESHNHETESVEAGHDHDHESAPEATTAPSHEGEIMLSPSEALAAGVQTEIVKAAPFAEVMKVSGRVMPTQGGESTVSATMDGVVTLRHAFTDGASVNSGTPLLTISAAPITDGNPAAAAQAELKAARAALDRARKLTADGAMSQRELEAAEQRYEAADAAARNWGGASRTRTIAAPIGGFLKNCSVRSGDFVTAGQPLAMVVQDRRLRLRADVPERFFSRLSSIRTANFRTGSDTVVHRLDRLNGRLIARGAAADDAGLFVPVTFEFDNADGVTAGAMAEIYLLGAERANVVSVPRSALTEAAGLYYVYVRVHDDAYRRRSVVLGADSGDRVEVVKGLEAGEEVVARGSNAVRLAAAAGTIPHGHQH